jgi:hypothetical protein
VGAFVLTAASILTKIGRDALYFQHEGLYDLPKAYLGMAMLSVPMSLLILRAMRRLGPRQTRLWALSGLTAFLLFYGLVAAPGGGSFMTVLYMFVPLTFGIAFSLYWLLAADLLEGAGHSQLGRSYSLVGASSIAGGLVGGVVARIAASEWQPRTLILLGAVAVAGSGVVVARAQFRFPPPTNTRVPRTAKRSLGDLWRTLRQRYVVLLLATGMATALVGLLVDFRFYVAAASSGNGAQQNASLFASVHLALNAGALVVQLLITPRLQNMIGVHGSLLVLPTALLGGATTLLASSSLFAPSLLRITEGGLRSSVHRVNWEQAFLPLKSGQRAQAKVVVDGMAARLAEGFIALLLLVWLRVVVDGRLLVGQDSSWITYALLAASLAWVVLTRALGRRLVSLTSGPLSPEAFRPAIRIPLPDT